MYTQLDYEDSLRKQAAESDGEGSGSEADGPGKLRLASKVDLNRCAAGGLPGACSRGHEKGGGAQMALAGCWPRTFFLFGCSQLRQSFLELPGLLHVHACHRHAV